MFAALLSVFALSIVALCSSGLWGARWVRAWPFVVGARVSRSELWLAAVLYPLPALACWRMGAPWVTVVMLCSAALLLLGWHAGRAAGR